MATTAETPDITVPGACHHMPIAPGSEVTERLAVTSGPTGQLRRAELTIGDTYALGPVRLGATNDAGWFDAIASHAQRCADWIRGAA